MSRSEPKHSTATSTAGRRSDAAQLGSREHRVQPGDLRAHVRELGGARGARSAHSPICSVPSGGLPRWSITIVRRGKRCASSGRSPRCRGKTQGSSSTRPRSSTAARLSSTLGAQDPVRIGLLVDQVANPSQRRLPRQDVEPRLRRRGRAEIDPRGDGGDPGVLRRLGEHRVGVAVGAGRLDENRAVDPARVEQGPQIGRARSRGRSSRARASSTASARAGGSRNADGYRSSIRARFSGEGGSPRRLSRTPGARRHQEEDDVLGRISRTSRRWPW